MSENIIKLIPGENYKFIPAPHIIQNLRGILDKHSNFYNIHVFDSVRFIDQGENFEYVACPSCSKILDLAWWQEEMTRSSIHDFEDLSIHMPCCNHETDLNHLNYHLPAGFAKFVIELRMNEEELSELIKEIEQQLACRIRMVTARY